LAISVSLLATHNYEVFILLFGIFSDIFGYISDLTAVGAEDETAFHDGVMFPPLLAIHDNKLLFAFFSRVGHPLTIGTYC
jgi:hypothetical protein